LKRNNAIHNLKKLYVLIKDVFGETINGYEYLSSLKLAITYLEQNKLKVSNDKYAIFVDNHDDYISVDICTKRGDLIETIKFENDQLLEDQVSGES
tara:strand:+ start:3784 stop:4071 length:288 start_codon:yes stop_codon:yes gene_type:complete